MPRDMVLEKESSPTVAGGKAPHGTMILRRNKLGYLASIWERFKSGRLVRWILFLYAILFILRLTNTEPFPASRVTASRSGGDGMYVSAAPSLIASLLSGNTITAASFHPEGGTCSHHHHHYPPASNEVALVNRLQLPLSQYHSRLPLYMMYSSFVDKRRMHVKALQKDWIEDSSLPTSTIASRGVRRAAVERETRSMLFALYVQRQYMRALRHADAMQLETLHFLRHLATGIPHLQKIWRGDVMCEWEGVKCHRLHIPLADFIDSDATAVKDYISLIHGDVPLKSREMSNISKTLLSPHTPSYWLEYPCFKKNQPRSETLGTFPYSNTLTTYVEEHDFMCTSPWVSTARPKIFLGAVNRSNPSPESGGAKNSVEELVHYYRSIGMIVTVERDYVTIPVPLVSLELQSMPLRGYIPEIFSIVESMSPNVATSAATTEDEKSGGREAPPLYVVPRLHERVALPDTPKCSQRRGMCNNEVVNIESPRDPAYWHFDNCYRGSKERDPLDSTSLDAPYRIASQAPRPIRDDVVGIFASVLSHLESVGEVTQHSDLANYFSDVAGLARFRGENAPRADMEEINIENYVRTARLSMRRINTQVFTATAVSSTLSEVNATFGEIEPRLVSLLMCDISSNPMLFGNVPRTWRRLPLLRYMDLTATGIVVHPDLTSITRRPRGTSRLVIMQSATTFGEDEKVAEQEGDDGDNNDEVYASGGGGGAGGCDNTEVAGRRPMRGHIALHRYLRSPAPGSSSSNGKSGQGSSDRDFYSIFSGIGKVFGGRKA